MIVYYYCKCDIYFTICDTLFNTAISAVLHLFYNLCNRLFCTIVVDVIFIV